MFKNLHCHYRMNPQPRLRSRGFTLTEVLIVIVIIAVLAAIMFPLVRGIRDKARAAVCAQNLKQIGIGLHAYISENSGRFPHGLAYQSTSGYGMSWYDAAAENMGREYVTNSKDRDPLPDAFGCPSGHGKAYYPAWPWAGDYAYNFRLGREGDVARSMASLKRPSETPFVQDTVRQNNFGEWIFGSGASKEADMAFADRHGGSGNILWVDMHVTAMRYSEYMDYAAKPSHNGARNFVRGNW